MSEQSSPRWAPRLADPAKLDVPELERILGELAHNSDEAEALLGALTQAFFPGGGNVGQLTWPDERAGHPVDDSPEARMRAAELRFRTLVEQIPAVTFMAVLGEGKNEVYVSPHIEAMLGFTQQEWLDNPFLWYWQLHPDDRLLWNAEFGRGCRTGGPFRADCRFISNDGRIVWVHGEARVVKDSLGRPSFLQGVAFDITEIKRAQDVLLNEAVRTARADEELAIARRVQTSILPRDPQVPGLEIGALMVPASEVGGDYYDVLPARDGCWLAIGDVAGHGLNAGLVMLMMQSSISAITRSLQAASPREVLLVLNEVLVENVRARLQRREHATFTLFRYRSDGTLSYAGAHEDILVYRYATKTVEQIGTSGAWVGARLRIEHVTVDDTLSLEDGDVVLLYSDGVTEAMSASLELFDIDRLRTVFAAHASEPAQQICESIHHEVRAFMQHQADDITLVAIRYRRSQDARH